MSIQGMAPTRPRIHFVSGRRALVVPVWRAEMEAHNKRPGDMLDEVFTVTVASDVFFGLGIP
jgi:hypothetical protein